MYVKQPSELSDAGTLVLFAAQRKALVVLTRALLRRVEWRLLPSLFGEHQRRCVGITLDLLYHIAVSFNTSAPVCR
jgi:hypothetical protein